MNLLKLLLYPAAFLKILFSTYSKSQTINNITMIPNNLQDEEGNLKLDNMAEFQQFIEHRRAANSIPYPTPVELDDKEVMIKDNGPMRTFIWNEQNNPNQQVIFYLHGGSYFKQPGDHYFKYLNEWSDQLQAKIIMPIYPKAPAYTFKDSADKLLEMYKEMLNQVNDPAQIMFIGDSAGAGLLMGLADYIAEHHLDQPKEIMLISPWLDISTNNPRIKEFQKVDPSLRQWQLQEYGVIWADGEENVKNPLVSPLYSHQLQNLGKLTIIIGTHELFYPDSELLHEKLSELNVSHNFIVGDKLTHDFALEDTTVGEETRALMMDIIEKNLSDLKVIV